MIKESKYIQGWSPIEQDVHQNSKNKINPKKYSRKTNKKGKEVLQLQTEPTRDFLLNLYFYMVEQEKYIQLIKKNKKIG